MVCPKWHCIAPGRMSNLPVAALNELLPCRNADMALKAGLLGFVARRSVHIAPISLLMVLRLFSSVCLGSMLLVCTGCGIRGNVGVVVTVEWIVRIAW